MNATALGAPNVKSLTSCLIVGLLMKIALTTACLAPPHWLSWTGPRPSEAATSPTTEDKSNPPLPRLLALVDKERQALLTREAAAAAKEEQLTLIKQEVEERLQELQALQNRILETLEEEQRIKAEHNRHLVSTLQAMSPDRASKLLENMKEDEAVRLLRCLSGKEAGVILSLLPPETAARLSHRLLQ